MKLDELAIKKYDLFSKIGLGIIGSLITILIAMNQYKIQEAQNEYIKNQDKIKSNDQKEQSKIEILKVLFYNLQYSSEPGTKGDISRAIIVYSTKKLSEDYESSDIVGVINDALNSNSEFRKSLTSNQKVIIEESSTENSGKQSWFCVLATFGTNSFADAIKFKNEINKNQFANFNAKAQVYKTKISNSYAITLGDSLTKIQAINYLSYSKSANFNDAFYQINRNWSKVQ
jgi:hypothetical protein